MDRWPLERTTMGKLEQTGVAAGRVGADRHGKEQDAESHQQSAHNAAQGDHQAAGADRTNAGVGQVDAADEAGGLGAGQGGSGLGQVLFGPLQQRAAVLHFGHLIGIAGTDVRPGFLIGGWSWPVDLPAPPRRPASNRKSTSTPRRASVNSSCNCRPISSSDSLAARTRGCSADIVPINAAVRRTGRRSNRL